MIYSLAFLLYMILVSPVYLLRMVRGRYRESFLLRLGLGLEPLRASETPRYWVHACSVGEVEAAAPLVALLRRLRPEHPLVLSTVTETGQARARQLFPHDDVRYLPFDFRFAIRRHLKAVGPLAGFIIMETEIWPNLIKVLARCEVPVFIANGRISDRAWPRYRAFAPLFRPLLRRVAVVAARTELDAERFRRLGAEKVEAVGNIKFDREPAPLPADPPHGRLVIFGSTHPGEEKLALDIFRRLRKDHPGLRLLIAPRHIERAVEVAALTGGRRRSQGWHNEDILVLDTHGELAGLYAVCEVAFIGGSLVPIGGHNPIEAAIHGVPTVWGPHMENFRDACGLLERHGGYPARDAEDAARIMSWLLREPHQRREAGRLAKAVVLENRGALTRTWRLFFPR